MAVHRHGCELMAKYCLLDGYNLAFRAYYALPDLTRADGFPTGALHGWIKTLWKVEDMELPDAVGIFFDEGGATEREALLESYKANRTEMPEPMQQQMPHLETISQLAGYPVIKETGVEADDLIASAANQLSEAGHNVVIVSADKDLGQCLNTRVKQLLPAPTANPRLGWRMVDVEALTEKLGVSPKQVVDYLALIGDSSDNIPGIAGVGPKTAAKWLQQYGDLSGILNNTAALMPKRFREVVADSAELLQRNRKLVRLNTEHVIPEIARLPRDVSGLIQLLETMEMKQSASQAHDRYGLGL